MANSKNINHIIELIKRTQRVNMSVFQLAPSEANQRNRKNVTTYDEFHSCGNTACIAGYVAISPGFQKIGKACPYHGSPELRVNPMCLPDFEEDYGSAEIAVSIFFDIPIGAADMLIYGKGSGLDIENWSYWNWEHAVTALEIVRDFDYTQELYLINFHKALDKVLC